MIEFKKLCDYCGEPLRARPAQNAYKDFEERNLHIKCFKEIGPLSAQRLKKKSNDNINMKKDKRDNWKINFGKHKGETFKQLLDDEDYCNWIIENDDFNNKELKDYINKYLN